MKWIDSLIHSLSRSVSHSLTLSSTSYWGIWFGNTLMLSVLPQKYYSLATMWGQLRLLLMDFPPWFIIKTNLRHLVFIHPFTITPICLRCTTVPCDNFYYTSNTTAPYRLTSKIWAHPAHSPSPEGTSWIIPTLTSLILDPVACQLIGINHTPLAVTGKFAAHMIYCNSCVSTLAQRKGQQLILFTKKGTFTRC